MDAKKLLAVLGKIRKGSENKLKNKKKLLYNLIWIVIVAVVAVVLFRNPSLLDSFTGDGGDITENEGGKEKEEKEEKEQKEENDEKEPEQKQEPEDTPSDPDAKKYVFRNKSLLSQHYDKHGKEMGFASAEEYEAAASDVINNKSALHKTEKEDGDFVYYIEKTNEFVILSQDGYIRTYFLPSAGLDYYNRQ